MLLYQILAYAIPGKISKSHTKTKNIKYQLQHEMKKFELPDESCSVSNNQGYLKYIIEKHEAVTDNPLIRNM